MTGWPTIIARRYREARDAGTGLPTAAVLVRRNADAAPMADALAARGVPVEVVGLAGLLAVTEVADVVAMLRLVADPSAGAAAMRVLTGPRWRLGGRDISALWRRAVDLDDVGGPRDRASADEVVAQAAPDADTACLADAISDPGPAGAYSREGHRRIVALGHELTGLRAHLTHPLPELVAEVRRVLGVDVEARAARPPSAGWSGTEHLDSVRRRRGRLFGSAARCGGVGSARVPRCRHDRRERPGSRRGAPSAKRRGSDRGARPGADPHRACRQGPGVAGGGRATPERACVSVDGVDANLAHRRGRSAPAAAWRPRHRWRPRCPGARHIRRHTIESSCRTRYPNTSAASTSAASTRNADCYTWRSPARRTHCCCPVITGAPSEAKPRGPSEFLCELKDIIDGSATETIDGSAAWVSRAVWSNTGHLHLPTGTRIRCGTRWSRRYGLPIQRERAAATWIAGPSWSAWR